MSYKTILVHLNDTRRAEALLEPAIQLATRYNSHLLGLHVYATMPAPPVPMGYASSVLGPSSPRSASRQRSSPRRSCA